MVQKKKSNPKNTVDVISKSIKGRKKGVPKKVRELFKKVKLETPLK